jgi:cyclic beta-1,2-glucan synthetase
VCKIDLICQAWSGLSGITDAARVKSSLISAKSLVKSNELVALLEPPFDMSKYYGYISAYPKGVRENGGQYTHSAVWYMMALSQAGMTEEAYKILKMLNPINKMSTPGIRERYKGEPYAVAADVYTGENFGRAGWSWYTGSASWLYKAIFEDIIGIRLRRNCLVFDIKLPDALPSCKVEYKYGSATYRINIEKKGEFSLTCNGKRLNGNEIHLRDEEMVNTVSVEY